MQIGPKIIIKISCGSHRQYATVTIVPEPLANPIGVRSNARYVVRYSVSSRRSSMPMRQRNSISSQQSPISIGLNLDMGRPSGKIRAATNETEIEGISRYEDIVHCIVRSSGEMINYLMRHKLDALHFIQYVGAAACAQE